LAVDDDECQPLARVTPEDTLPTYQYSCTECSHFFEAVQSFSDDSLTVCPVCQGRLRKVFNAVGVVFKGSGFYRNDSRSQNGQKEGASSGAKSESASSTSTPSEGGSSGSGSSSSTSGSAASSGSSSPSSPSPTPAA
jgi:putative FmdB family regulatory protein